ARPMGRGAGLGLVLSAAIVRQHGGRLSATALERGARFSLELPLRRGSPEQAGPPVAGIGQGEATQPLPSSPLPVDLRARSGGRILVCDDEENVRELIARCLEKFGFDVVRARSGEEALERLREAPVDGLLTDL